MGLDSVPENKFCLGGGSSKTKKTKKINDLCHFFTHFILREWIIFQEMEEVLAKATTGIL